MKIQHKYNYKMKLFLISIQNILQNKFKSVVYILSSFFENTVEENIYLETILQKVVFSILR